VPSHQIAEAISAETALVVVTEVHYKTGALQNMAQLNAQAHAQGALVLWDLSHSTGVLPVALNATEADYAVGCGYKYLNGGPGAPAFAYVARAHQAALAQPLWGWFGHQQPFAMQPQYAPAQGMNQLLTGTTSILAGSALECSLSVFADIDRAALRLKSHLLTQLLIERVQHPELELVTPRSPEHRGSQVSWRHPEGYAITQALIARGVIGDFRSPDILRMGIAPLYIGYADVLRAADLIQAVVADRLWDRPEFQQRQAVT
jgi:kynureninase